MALRDAVSVRFDEATRERLQAIADQSGLSPAELVRRATREFMDRAEAQGHINISIGGGVHGGVGMQVAERGGIFNIKGKGKGKKKKRKKT